MQCYYRFCNKNGLGELYSVQLRTNAHRISNNSKAIQPLNYCILRFYDNNNNGYF